MTPYGSMCDDFAVQVNLATKMELPGRRETVLHLFESLKKSFPKMTDFDRREGGDFTLEEERAHVTSIALQRWHGAPEAGRWLHQTALKVPGAAKLARVG